MKYYLVNYKIEGVKFYNSSITNINPFKFLKNIQDKYINDGEYYRRVILVSIQDVTLEYLEFLDGEKQIQDWHNRTINQADL